MDIKLEPVHLRNLLKVMDYADLGKIPISTTSEAKPETTLMTSKEIEQLTYGNQPVVVKVDDAIIQKIPKLIDEFKESADWYYSFNNAITKMMGESEGSFFLTLMAGFSAQVGLEQNLALATRAYHALEADLKGDKDTLQDFVNYIDNMSVDEKKNIKKTLEILDRNNPDNSFSKLRYYKFILEHGRTSNHLKVANKIIQYYFKSNMNISKKALTKLISSYLEKSGDLKKGYMIGKYKIFNFVLNLLDPDYEIEGIGWMPVTIDSWMIYFFYPDIFKLDMETKKKEKGKIFSKYKVYTYLAKIVQEQAHKFNMKPHQLQSLLWTASIRKYLPNASDKDIHSTLEYMIQEFNKDQEELKKMTKFIESLNKIIK